MDPLTYLTTFSPNFGAPEWVFFIAQIGVALAGVYLGFLRADTHALRGPALRRLGYGLIALGAAGTLVGALRLVPVELFTMPIWMTIITLLEVIFAAYVLYYATSVYPARVAAFEEANRSKGARRGVARPQPTLQANGTNGASSLNTPRPIVTTSRREARRDRKRRGR
jgi:hypothetical protein